MISGNVTFETKTLNCERSGGIAAIIYNNEPGTIEGKLSNSNQTKIPALQISSFNGDMLTSDALGTALTIEEKMGYGYLSGTSMAVPHVTGVIAKVWRMVRLLYVRFIVTEREYSNVSYSVFSKCPSCTNQEIEKCILDTALDLGDPGRDDLYGQGLVQAIPAYLCLKNATQCC